MPEESLLNNNLGVMETTIDQAGRIVIPKQLRDRLGLVAGSVVDVSEYGEGLHISRQGRTAKLEHQNGKRVAVSSTQISDEDVLGLIDTGRR
jgi:AbrB family looped-hinge helix DNA binding protein